LMCNTLLSHFNTVNKITLLYFIIFYSTRPPYCIYVKNYIWEDLFEAD